MFLSRALLFALPLLAGCTQVGGGIRSLAVAEGPTLRAPAGYCLSPAASNVAAGFAVFNSCDVLGRVQAAGSILTIQLGAENSAVVAGNEANVAAFFASRAGRASLSHRNRAEDITLEAVERSAGQVRLRYQDRARSGTAQLEPQAWRVVMDLEGRAVTLSLRTLAPLTPEAGMAILRQTAAVLTP